MIKAALFDLDGTLIDSLEDLMVAGNYALSLRGYPGHDLESYKYFVGDGVYEMLERGLPAEKRNPDEVAALYEIYTPYYREHSMDVTKPYPGIPELLAALKRRQVKIACVSNKPDENTKFIVEKFFGSGLFDLVTGAVEGFAPKPDPALTLKVMERLGVSPGECVFIGDMDIDMKTASASGATAVGVTWGFRSEAELLEAGAQLLIHRPEELLKYLEA